MVVDNFEMVFCGIFTETLIVFGEIFNGFGSVFCFLFLLVFDCFFIEFLRCFFPLLVMFLLFGDSQAIPGL